MRREHVRLYGPSIGREMSVLAYGHGGLPVLVFPTSCGSVHEYEDRGMVHALAEPIERGRVRLYCVESYDGESWLGGHLAPHDRAWRHARYEAWIMEQVVPGIRGEVGDAAARLVATGCSFGAYHAANVALKHPATFAVAVCLSGVYDVRFLLDGHHDDWVYFNNPLEFVPRLSGETLEAVRRTFLLLVCGQGQWEERQIASTRALWHVLDAQQIPSFMDLWGHDVAHDWPWWREQIAHHLGRLAEGGPPWPST